MSLRRPLGYGQLVHASLSCPCVCYSSNLIQRSYFVTARVRHVKSGAILQMNKAKGGMGQWDNVVLFNSHYIMFGVEIWLSHASNTVSLSRNLNHTIPLQCGREILINLIDSAPTQLTSSKKLEGAKIFFRPVIYVTDVTIS
ncbi:hypothetical protein B0H19DRAFT_1084454 [Mycena capillaripes]|nr:hypothetical protein B0H19DRAFT_1084454 [Mycena capillaripes]